MRSSVAGPQRPFPCSRSLACVMGNCRTSPSALHWRLVVVLTFIVLYQWFNFIEKCWKGWPLILRMISRGMIIAVASLTSCAVALQVPQNVFLHWNRTTIPFLSLHKTYVQTQALVVFTTNVCCLFEDSCARNMFLRHGQWIPSHSICGM